MDIALSKEKEQLVIEHQGLVYYCLRQYEISSYSSDYEDLVSEGKIGLIKAAINFDSTRGTKFTTYAYYCIKNNITLYFKKINKHLKSIPISDIKRQYSDFSFESFMVESNYNSERQLINREKAIDTVNWILNCLDKRSKILILFKIAGQTAKKTAKYFNTSITNVTRWQRKILQKIQNHDKAQVFYKVEFYMTGEIYQFTFKLKDIQSFKKDFENFLKELSTTKNIPSFTIDYLDQYAVLQIEAIPESLCFIAMCINEMYEMIFTQRYW